MNDKIDKFIWAPKIDELESEKKWIRKTIFLLGLTKLKNLSRIASKIRKNAYTPYSNYNVGVALLTASGKIYEGINAERASYSETDHAEESSVTNAIINGEIKKSGRKFVIALAVSHEGNTAPCGRCRQIIAEHCDNALIITADPSGNIRKITSLKILFPYAFTPSDLGK